MSEQAKHTPGPWEIARVHGVPIGVGIRYSTHGPTTVFTMIGNTLAEGDGEPERAEIEANARLIAAAPELLASCKELLAVFEWCCKNIPRHEMMRLFYAAIPGVEDEFDDRAEAAIAKAEVKS